MDVQRALRAGRSCRTCTRAGTDAPPRPRAARACPARARRSRFVGARPLDDVLDARRLLQRLVDRLAHRHARAPAERVVRGDHGLGSRVLQALHDRRRGEAGEDRHLDGADVGAGVGGDRGLGRHRHVDRDPVARADAERDERLGEPRHLRGQLGERPLVARARPRSGRRPRPRRACAPPTRCTQAWATFSRAPSNQVAHSIPRESSRTRSHGCENSSPRSSTTRARSAPAPRPRRGGAPRSRRSRAAASAG